MNFLDNLLPNQRDLLVSLPYRIGLYISECDKTGGDESNEVESSALSGIIIAYSQEIFGAETVQYIISETVSRKKEWSQWASREETVESDCYKAIDILSDVVDIKEINAFKRSLIEIGEAVALAFREYGETTSMVDKIKVYMLYMQSRSKAAKLGIIAKEWDQFINISLEERKALQSVAQALNTTYM